MPHTTHPHPNPPLEGEGANVKDFLRPHPPSSPLEGEGANVKELLRHLILTFPLKWREQNSSPFKGEVGWGMGEFISVLQVTAALAAW